VGDYKEAAEELERALAVDAEKTVSREIRFHLGSIYEQVARRDKAIKAYEAYLSRYPSTPQARAARRRLKELK
jgi:regulator of sirC expression with transglutaminase-like and TPR domain